MAARSLANALPPGAESLPTTQSGKKSIPVKKPGTARNRPPSFQNGPYELSLFSPRIKAWAGPKRREFGLSASPNERTPSEVNDPSTSSSTDSSAPPLTPEAGIPSISAPEANDGQGQGNIGLVVLSAIAGAGLFVATRFSGFGVDLTSLSEMSTPYDIALGNGKPTVIEFYADWCEVCKGMVKDVYNIESEYRDEVNFVLLNIDNTKWSDEVREFGVDGIPQFTFLDSAGNEEGSVVGKIPPKFLLENVAALAKGKKGLPHTNEVGTFSLPPDSRTLTKQVEPRSHGI